MKKMGQDSPGMDRAMKNLEQAKARYEEEKRKANTKRRKAENHHKYMMGGIIVQYFPDCYQYEEEELNEILSTALSTRECKAAIARVRTAAEKGMEGGKESSGYADDEKENVGYADDTEMKNGGYARLRDGISVGGGSYGQEL